MSRADDDIESHGGASDSDSGIVASVIDAIDGAAANHQATSFLNAGKLTSGEPITGKNTLQVITGTTPKVNHGSPPALPVVQNRPGGNGNGYHTTGSNTRAAEITKTEVTEFNPANDNTAAPQASVFVPVAVLVDNGNHHDDANHEPLPLVYVEDERRRRGKCPSRRGLFTVFAAIGLVVLGSILTAVVMTILPSSSSPPSSLSNTTGNANISGPMATDPADAPNPSPIEQQQPPPYAARPFTYNERLDRSANVVNFINSITWKTSSDGISTTYQRLRLSNDTTSNTILLEERALEWIVNGDALQLSPDSRLHQLQLQQRYALATLYVNIFDASTSSSASTMSECDWEGVTCDAATTSIVTKIELGSSTDGSNSAWVGADSRRSLSVDLALLTSLQSFDVSNSDFIGSIPSSLGPAWSSSLQIFDVHTNALMGSLPSSIGQWTQLLDFKVHDNALTGTIPSSISLWNRTIKEAAFDTNPGLTGTMPNALCQANTPDLVYLAADEDMPCSCCTCCSRDDPL